MVLESVRFILLQKLKQVDDQFSPHQLLKRLSLLHCIFLPHLSKKGVHRCVGLSLGFLFCSIDLYFCFGSVLYCLDDCGFVVEPEVRQVDFSSSFFFLRIALAIQGFLYFHTNCEIIYSSSLKNTIGSLIGITLIGTDTLIGIASIDCFG